MEHELIETELEIQENIKTLNNYLMNFSKDSDEFIFAQSLINKGIKLMPYYNLDEKILGFYPSKFIGYKNNDYKTHMKYRQERDGRKTSGKIDRVLRIKYREEIICKNNSEYEKDYQTFIKKIQGKPDNRERKFWHL